MTNRRTLWRSAFSLLMAVGLLLSGPAVPLAAEESAGETLQAAGETVATGSYAAYAAANASFPPAKADYRADGGVPSARSENTAVETDYRGTGESCTVIPDDGYAEWTIEVPQDGLYEIEIRYMPGESAGGDVEADFAIDGQVPFKEVALLSFKRTYIQEQEFRQNVAGNDIKPDVTEVFLWSDHRLTDASGYLQEPFRFALTAGSHTLRLTGSRGSLAVAAITIAQGSATESYADYLARHEAQGHTRAQAEPIVWEAEKLLYKTSQTIVPTADHSSAATSPQDPAALKLNTVGGDNWKQVGDAITWSFHVETAGMYTIAVRFRQDVLDGIFTSRRLLLDGNVPFREAEGLRFHYSSDWQVGAFGDENGSFRFYLSEGDHTLTLEAVMGDVAEMVGQVEDSLNEMNAIYRRIIMVTGTSPDRYRDYHFESLIPEEIAALGEQRDALQQAADVIDREAGTNGSYTSIIKKIIFQLDRMYTEPASIAKYLEQFKSNLGSLGSWLLTASEQPLQLDRFYLLPAGDPLPEAGAGVWESLVFGVKSFIATFFLDYSSIGQTADGEGLSRELKVWVQTGRDQAEILRQLIDTSFAAQNDARVTLELVASGTLLQSVLAGLAPDVALSNAVSEPINYAIRNANVDLTQFPDFEEVAARFHPAAIEPYAFDGRVYALPETFTFYMFFYRTDIFDELGLTVPGSWEELIELIPLLQRKNLTMGIPHDANMYALLLYQNGGELYSDEGASTNLGSNEGLNAFLELTELFTLYDLPVTFDFANRFRSGEMPCGIQDYSMYNQLTAFAPEIRGMWRMVPVPGREAGESLSVGTGTNAMIIRSGGDTQLAWEFLKWWMSADVQSEFAVNMESVLGPAAKQPTANLEALTRMTWSRDEYTNLLAQLDNVRAVPEVPGGYYLSRIITFAFNRVYNGSGAQTMAENPVEVIAEYINEFNDELTRKREEFGIQ